MSERSEAQNDKDQAAAPSSELTVKHPLQNAWVLWFDNPVKRLGAKDWSSNLKKVGRMELSKRSCRCVDTGDGTGCDF